MNTTITKDLRNTWKAETKEMITPELQLTMTTRKMSDGYLVTAAHVSKLEGNFLRHALYEDMNQRICSTKPKRVTSKVVEAQHAFVDFDNIKSLAFQFYGIES
jgi:hypothetical protein